MKTLDKSKPYADIFGETSNNARYAQDGVYFNVEGNEIGGKKPKSAPAPEQPALGTPGSEGSQEEAAADESEATPYDDMTAAELKQLVTDAGGDYINKKSAIEFLESRDSD